MTENKNHKWSKAAVFMNDPKQLQMAINDLAKVITCLSAAAQDFSNDSEPRADVSRLARVFTSLTESFVRITTLGAPSKGVSITLPEGVWTLHDDISHT